MIAHVTVDELQYYALPIDAFGRTVGLGRDLIVHTAATIGPDATDPAKRFSGNGLECESCHLDAGRKKFGLPLAGVWGLFPQFIGRETPYVINQLTPLPSGSINFKITITVDEFI